MLYFIHKNIWLKYVARLPLLIFFFFYSAEWFRFSELETLNISGSLSFVPSEIFYCLMKIKQRNWAVHTLTQVIFISEMWGGGSLCSYVAFLVWLHPVATPAAFCSFCLSPPGTCSLCCLCISLCFSLDLCLLLLTRMPFHIMVFWNRLMWLLCFHSSFKSVLCPVYRLDFS